MRKYPSELLHGSLFLVFLNELKVLRIRSGRGRTFAPGTPPASSIPGLNTPSPLSPVYYPSPSWPTYIDSFPSPTAPNSFSIPPGFHPHLTSPTATSEGSDSAFTGTEVYTPSERSSSTTDELTMGMNDVHLFDNLGPRDPRSHLPVRPSPVIPPVFYPSTNAPVQMIPPPGFPVRATPYVGYYSSQPSGSPTHSSPSRSPTRQKIANYKSGSRDWFHLH